MTNFEKYKDEICEIIKERGVVSPVPVNGKIISCADILCIECPFKSDYGNCNKKRIDWLNAEYQEVDWSKVPIDTKILVRDFEDGAWLNRYFAGYDEESMMVKAFTMGTTSWSASSKTCVSNITHWKYAKLAESDAKE